MRTYAIYGPIGPDFRHLFHSVFTVEGDWESTQEAAEAVVASGVLQPFNPGEWKVMPPGGGPGHVDEITLMKGGERYRFVEPRRLELPVAVSA